MLAAPPNARVAFLQQIWQDGYHAGYKHALAELHRAVSDPAPHATPHHPDWRSGTDPDTSAPAPKPKRKARHATRRKKLTKPERSP